MSYVAGECAGEVKSGEVKSGDVAAGVACDAEPGTMGGGGVPRGESWWGGVGNGFTEREKGAIL